MKRILSFMIIIVLIMSVGISILVYGANTVCTNMNAAYLIGAGGKDYGEGSIDPSGYRNETYIPYFLSVQEPEPYLYELSIMGKRFNMDIKKYADAANMLKLRLDLYMDSKKVDLP